MSETVLRLTEQDVQIIVDALLDKPGRVCLPVLNKMQAQINQQQAESKNGNEHN